MSLDDSQTWSLTARWVFPVAAPPLARGVLTVRGDRLLAVEPAGRRTPDVDLGNVALLPGFVNAHTHLDLSGLRGRVPPGPDFTGWLRAVIRHRRGQAPSEVEGDVRAGLAESLSHGTTLLGDVSALGLSWPVLAGADVRAVVFHELLGLPPDRVRRAWDAARAWLNGHPATPTCRPGLSPHAPYSVHAALYGLAARLARERHVPVMTHLAETREELHLLARHAGPFVDFLTELGVWDPAGLSRSPEQVLRRHRGASPVLFAHGNYLNADAPVPDGATVVYCPRTHAAFGHAPHPFRSLLARGVRVALGTDSLASNPDLSVLAEARFLYHQYPELAGAALLRLATLSGAEALGWADETGSLEAGKSADAVVLDLPDAEPADPHALVLAASRPVRAVLWCGRWVYDGCPDGIPGRPPETPSEP